MAEAGSDENGGKLENSAGLIAAISIAYETIVSPAPGILEGDTYLPYACFNIPTWRESTGNRGHDSSHGVHVPQSTWLAIRRNRIVDGARGAEQGAGGV